MKYSKKKVITLISILVFIFVCSISSIIIFYYLKRFGYGSYLFYVGMGIFFVLAIIFLVVVAKTSKGINEYFLTSRGAKLSSIELTHVSNFDLESFKKHLENKYEFDNKNYVRSRFTLDYGKQVYAFSFQNTSSFKSKVEHDSFNIGPFNKKARSYLLIDFLCVDNLTDGDLGFLKEYSIKLISLEEASFGLSEPRLKSLLPLIYDKKTSSLYYFSFKGGLPSLYKKSLKILEKEVKCSI